MEQRSQDRIVEEAARWYARLQAPDCTRQEHEEFERWRSFDPAHARAFAAAKRLAEQWLGGAAANPRLKAMAEEAYAAGASIEAAPSPYRAFEEDDALEGDAVDGTAYPRSPAPRRWALPAALAAGVAVVSLAVGVAHVSAPPHRAAAFRYQVATSDQQRELRLEDGSVVHLDVGSEIEVSLTAAERAVELLRGRAMFDVAHDAERPFSVTAGSGRVTALGTRFQVARDPGQIVVTLAEGAVTVARKQGGEGRSERLAPGQELRMPVRGDDAWVKRDVDAAAATSWSTGRLVFRDARLADAVAEVNRYSATKVRLGDPALDDLRVSGSFLTGDSHAAVAAFAATLPIRITDAGDALLLFPRRDPDSR